MSKKLSPIEHPCSRRAFLQGLGIAGASLVALSACGTSGSALPTGKTTTCGGGGMCLDLTDPANSDLVGVGGAMLVDTSADTIMVIRTSDTAVLALSAICTHAGCTMDFVPAQNLLDCSCHGSQFDEQGRVLRGPARTPLKVYTATLANNMITIAA